MSKKFDFLAGGSCDKIASTLSHCRTKPADHINDVAIILAEIKMYDLDCGTIESANKMLAALVHRFLNNEHDHRLMLAAFAITKGYEELNVNARRRKYIKETGYEGIGKPYNIEVIKYITDTDLKKRCQKLEQNEKKLIGEITKGLGEVLKLDAEDNVDEAAVRLLKEDLLNIIQAPAEEEAEPPERSESTMFNFVDEVARHRQTEPKAKGSQKKYPLIISEVSSLNAEDLPPLEYGEFDVSQIDVSADEMFADLTEILSLARRNDRDSTIRVWDIQNALITLGKRYLDEYRKLRDHIAPDTGSKHPARKTIYIAIRYFHEAYRIGSQKAGYYIALCYFFGYGLVQSKQQTETWLRRAIRRKDCDAVETLAVCYEYGLLGKAPNHDKAEEVLNKHHFVDLIGEEFSLFPTVNLYDPFKVDYPEVFGVPVNQLMGRNL